MFTPLKVPTMTTPIEKADPQLPRSKLSKIFFRILMLGLLIVFILALYHDFNLRYNGIEGRAKIVAVEFRNKHTNYTIRYSVFIKTYTKTIQSDLDFQVGDSVDIMINKIDYRDVDFDFDLMF